ncbi:MAG TPA: glutathione transferase GstA [Allosphingosinicella sp.]|jgi:glutathione S-transferase
MKLYYSPGACSQAPHIALREAGLAFDLVKADIRAKKLEDGSSYLDINPKGAVPALGLDDGAVLTENAAILQYIGDQAPQSGLFPVAGDFQRYRVLEWLNYVATELHKGFAPLWNPTSPDSLKQATRELLAKKFDYVQEQLGERPCLLGEQFTLPDAYLFVILGWTRIHGIDLSRWPGLGAYAARVAERPAVDATLRAEGLK